MKKSTLGVFPLRGTVNIEEKILLPLGAVIVHVGLDPGDKMQPAFWFIYPLEDDGDVMECERFIQVVATSPRHPWPEIDRPHKHMGSWFVGDVTFHLLELFR